VNPASGGLAGAIIYLEPVDASAALPANVPDNAATMIMQRDFTFEPHLAVVPPGHTVIYGNDDPANHNVRAETENPRNAFNVITTPEQTYEKRVEAEPPRAPIRIACDVHPWMAAWVYVIEHRLFAVSDEEGAFRVADIPPGFYNVVVEQPDGGLFAETQIDVQSGAAVRLSVNFEMTQLNRQASPSVQIEIVSSAGNAAPERHKTK
jgi:plastocyanin